MFEPSFNNLKIFSESLASYKHCFVIYNAFYKENKNNSNFTSIKSKILTSKENSTLLENMEKHLKNSYKPIFDSFISIFIPAEEYTQNLNTGIEKSLWKINRKFNYSILFE